MVCVLVLCRAGAILLLRHGLSVDNLEVTVCLLGMSPPADDDVLDSTFSMPTWNGTLSNPELATSKPFPQRKCPQSCTNPTCCCGNRRALFYALPRLFAVAEDARPTKGKSSKKRRRLSESDLAATDPTAALGDECVEWAVAAVHQCVLYDSLGFMTKERFEALYVPLVDLLADAYEDTARFHARVDTYLKPAIVQLAVAVQGSTGSTILWKPLNYHLLMHTRHDSPSVRFAALTVAQALVERLGEEYLTLVPETLPFVVEVLEDMDEQVESAARSLVAALECLLGESLNEYLTQ